MTDAVLGRTVEVVILREPGLLARLDESIHHGVARPALGHRERPAGAVQISDSPRWLSSARLKYGSR